MWESEVYNNSWLPSSVFAADIIEFDYISPDQVNDIQVQQSTLFALTDTGSRMSILTSALTGLVLRLE